MPYIGKRLLQVITDKRLDEHPIFFHVFSNGGAFLYQHVSLAMQKANTLFKVQNTNDVRKDCYVSLSIYNKRMQNDPLSYPVKFFHVSYFPTRSLSIIL